MFYPAKIAGQLVFLIGIVLLFHTGCNGPVDEIPLSTDSQLARTNYLEGLDLTNRFRGGEARVYFENAVQVDSLFAMAYYRLAFTENSAEGFEGCLSRAYELSEDASPYERLMIASSYAGYIENDETKRLELAQELSESYPRLAQAQFYYGVTLFNLNRYDDAIAVFEAIREMYPYWAPAYNLLGYLYFYQDRNEEAEAAFTEYIRLFPEEPNPYDSMGDFLMKTGRFEESIENCQRALELNPGFTASQRNIGRNLIFLGRYEEGRETLRQTVAESSPIGQRIAVDLVIARSYAFEGRYRDALEAYDALAELVLENSMTVVYLNICVAKALLYREMDDFEQSNICLEEIEQTLQNTVFSEGNNTLFRNQVYCGKGYIAADQGNYDEVNRWASELQLFIENHGNATDLQKYYNPLMGYIHLKQQHFAEAVSFYSQSFQLNPYNLYFYALAEAGAGNSEHSTELMESAIHWNQDHLEWAIVKHMDEE